MVDVERVLLRLPDSQKQRYGFLDSYKARTLLLPLLNWH